MYARLVGEAWDVLPAIVRTAHVPGVAQGRLRVRRGASLLARCVGFVMRLPSAGDAVPVRLEIMREGDGLLWRRTFGTQTLVSRQETRDDLVLESFGPFVCAFVLEPTRVGVAYRQVRFGVRVGPWIAWLPRFVSARVRGTLEATEHGSASVRVTVDAPLVGPLLGYEGEITVEASA